MQLSNVLNMIIHNNSLDTYNIVQYSMVLFVHKQKSIVYAYTINLLIIILT